MQICCQLCLESKAIWQTYRLWISVIAILCLLPFLSAFITDSKISWTVPWRQNSCFGYNDSNISYLSIFQATLASNSTCRSTEQTRGSADFSEKVHVKLSTDIFNTCDQPRGDDRWWWLFCICWNLWSRHTAESNSYCTRHNSNKCDLEVMQYLEDNKRDLKINSAQLSDCKESVHSVQCTSSSSREIV